MGTAQPGNHREIDPGQAFASAVGRVIWTFFAFVVAFIGWAALTHVLLGIHQVWGYALFAIATLLFIVVIGGLRSVWRDGRYW